MKDAWKSLGRGALIILLTVAAYGPALRGGFVFDDSALIIGNWNIQTSDGLCRLWLTTRPADNVAKSPNAWVAHYNLGVALAASDRIPEAIAHYEQTLLLEPDDRKRTTTWVRFWTGRVGWPRRAHTTSRRYVSSPIWLWRGMHWRDYRLFSK